MNLLYAFEFNWQLSIIAFRGGFLVNPCELNVVIAAVTNYLYDTLSEREFVCLNIIVSELSKSMFSMELLRQVCENKSKDECKL